MQGWYGGSRMYIAWTGIHFCIQGNSHDLYQRSGVNRPRFFDAQTLLIGAGADKSCARHGQGNEIMKKVLFMVMLMCVAIKANSQNVKQSIEAYGGVSIDNYSKYSFGTSYSIGGTLASKFHIGGGVGFRYIEALYYTSSLTSISESYDGKFLIPLFARVTVNLTDEGVRPFLRCDLGYTFDVGQNQNKNTEGLFFHPAVGFNFSTSAKSSIYLAVGLNVQHTHYQKYGVPIETVDGYTSNLIISIGMSF